MSHFGRAGPPDIRDTYSLLVLNITFRTTPDDLYPLFDRYGKVVDIFIPRDRRSGESRGFAFVRYKHVDEAQKAVERLDGVDVDGRQIAVQFAKYGRNDEKISHGRITSLTRRSRSRSPRRISSRHRDDYAREYQEHRYRSRSRERYGRERERERSRDGYRYDDNRSRDAAAYGRDRYERERPRERDAYDRDRSRDVYDRDRSREAFERDRSREVLNHERERGREMYDRDRSRDRPDGRSRDRFENERFTEGAPVQVQRGSPPKRSLSPAARMSPPPRVRDVSRGRSVSPVQVDGATYDKRTGKSRSLEPRASRSPGGGALPDSQHGKSISPGVQSPAPLDNGLEVHSPYNTDPDDA